MTAPSLSVYRTETFVHKPPAHKSHTLQNSSTLSPQTSARCKRKMQRNATVTEKFAQLHRKYADKRVQSLRHLLAPKSRRSRPKPNDVARLCLYLCLFTVITLILAIHVGDDASESLLSWFLGIRCFVPNNYFVWEATRPISDCQFCMNVTKPITLHNATSDEFAPYAYTSKPVVVKKAVAHWRAYELFDFRFFKDLYERFEDGVRSVDEECQFLHFKSDFESLRDVLEMPKARSENLPGEKSWYVGWGNCHPQILKELRRFYTKPHFLPRDCEMPAKDYVFMGFDAGATMHLDFINRLMWQAQLKGSKTWRLLPSNECEDVCSPVTFQAEPGDAGKYRI